MLYNNRSVKSIFISRQNCQQCLSHLLPLISNLYPPSSLKPSRPSLTFLNVLPILYITSLHISMFKFHPSHLGFNITPPHGLVTNYKINKKWLNHTLLFLVNYSNADLVLTTIKDIKDYRFLSTAYFKQNMILPLCSHVTKAFLLLKYI